MVFVHISIKSYNISKLPVYSEQIYNTKFVQNLPLKENEHNVIWNINSKLHTYSTIHATWLADEKGKCF